MGKNLIEQQLELDIGTNLADRKYVFHVGREKDRARFPAKNKGIILLSKGKLFCRIENEKLTNQLQHLYDNCAAEWFGEAENMIRLEKLLNSYGYTMVNYSPVFVMKNVSETNSSEIQIFGTDRIKDFKNNKRFKEPFVFDPEYPDLLGALIKREGKTLGVAGVNQAGKYCLEIGIQVLPESQGQGLATALVEAVAAEAVNKYPEKFVIYRTQFTHTQSINVAIRSGFVLGWTEIIIGKLNKE